METLSLDQVRRLALARAGLLTPERTGLPRRGAGSGARARRAAYAVIDRFGYLQLDTISVAGARSHAIVLMSRLDGLAPEVAESLLRPGAPLFEYWGHEACWMPLGLYPAFGFRRRDCRVHPWWGDVLGEHRRLANELIERIGRDGPLRVRDLEERGYGAEMWDIGPGKRVLSALWSRGDLVVSERVSFHRTYDLAERVIPEHLRRLELDLEESLRILLLRALAGHGWASTGTLRATWRLRHLGTEIGAALRSLVDAGEIVPCRLWTAEGTRAGWIRPSDLELVATLARARPRGDRGLLLSPFDPLLWDRQRTDLLFGFHQVLEIYKPAPQREYGYYCLPVLAGEHLVARLDLKADRARGRLRIQACRFENEPSPPRDRAAAETALSRFAEALHLLPDKLPAAEMGR